MMFDMSQSDSTPEATSDSSAQRPVQMNTYTRALVVKQKMPPSSPHPTFTPTSFQNQAMSTVPTTMESLTNSLARGLTLSPTKEVNGSHRESAPLVMLHDGHGNAHGVWLDDVVVECPSSTATASRADTRTRFWRRWRKAEQMSPSPGHDITSLHIGIPTPTANRLQDLLVKYAETGTVWRLSSSYNDRRWMMVDLPSTSLFVSPPGGTGPFPKINLVQYLLRYRVNCIGSAILSVRLNSGSNDADRGRTLYCGCRNRPATKFVDFLIHGTTDQRSPDAQTVYQDRLDAACQRVRDTFLRRQAERDEREARERRRRNLQMQVLGSIREEHNEEDEQVQEVERSQNVQMQTQEEG